MVQGLKCRSMKCLKSPFLFSWTTHMFKLDTCLVLCWADIPNLVLTAENEERIRLSWRAAIPRTKVLRCGKFLLLWVKTNLQSLSLKFSKGLIFSQQMLWARVCCLFIIPGKRRIVPFLRAIPLTFTRAQADPAEYTLLPSTPSAPLWWFSLTWEYRSRNIFGESPLMLPPCHLHTPHYKPKLIPDATICTLLLLLELNNVAGFSWWYLSHFRMKHWPGRVK